MKIPNIMRVGAQVGALGLLLAAVTSSPALANPECPVTIHSCISIDPADNTGGGGGLCFTRGCMQFRLLLIESGADAE